MAIYKTYEQIGMAEDVSDIISNISPTKTPFQSDCKSESIHAVLYEWQEDSLRAVADNKAVEGADATDVTVDVTTMRTNRTQIWQETVKVSNTADKIKTYGRAKEMAYQMAKSSAQVKRDREHAFVGLSNAVAAGDASTARETASFDNLVTTNTHLGTSTALNETALLASLSRLYVAGADPSVIMVTPSNSLVIADFAKAAGRYRQVSNGGDGKSVVNAVDLYVSQFGEQRVKLNRFLKAKDTLIYEPDMWCIATLRGWTVTALATVGDATKKQIVGEFGLKHKNFGASEVLTDNTA